MTFFDIMGSMLTNAAGVMIWLPFKIISLIGLLFPTCASFEYTSIIGVEGINNATSLIMWASPVLRLIPWTGIWTLASAYILYAMIRFIWLHTKWLLPVFIELWWIILIIFVVMTVVSWFTSSDWGHHSMIEQMMGAPATTTIEYGSGQGLGGGGGSGW